MMVRTRQALCILLLTLGLGSLAVPGVLAATFTVTNLNDSGAGSLRQALADAASAAGADTINFQSGLSGKITLLSALTINQDVTITGPGAANLTLMAGNTAVRIFTVTGGTSTISGMTITKGGTCAGGGNIDVAGSSLTLANSIVSDNRACPQPLVRANNSTLNAISTTISGSNLDGIEAVFSTLTLTNSTISGSANHGIDARDTTVSLSGSTVQNGGGGIYAARSPLTLTNSTVSGNTGNYGGMDIESNSPTTINGSTISGNHASGVDYAGGASILDSSATITNSTISGNRSNFRSAGLRVQGGTSVVNLRFVTITGNIADSDNDGTGDGGGIARFSGAVNLKSSIVAGNVNGGGQVSNCLGTIASQGNNVVGATCPNNGLTDQTVASIAAVLNPALAANGGPTQTHALVAGSPAIGAGAGTPDCPATDQRGVARPYGVNCDVGAFEADFPLALTLTTGGTGSGTVDRTPPGTGAGPTYEYPVGTVVTLNPQPAAGSTFVSWTVDGAFAGWASPLTITMNAGHTIQATFAPTAVFPDVGSGRADFAAIVALASRGTIRGYANGTYGPDDGVQRAQMAALIARAMPTGPGTPTNGTLTPPACVVEGSWDCEDWGNSFTDRGGIVASLWRNAGALQHYGVAFGYDGAACTARGVASPCYGPTAPVSYAETVTFITRAMVAKGYWVMQPGAPQPYAGVPSVFTTAVATFHFYTAGAGGIPAPAADWNAGATRGWFARALWQALNAYWGADRTP